MARARRRGHVPGDGAAFDALYRRHESYIRGYVRRRLSTSSDIEDAVSEAFLAAWRHRRPLPPEPQTRLWLTRAAFHAVSNTRRAQQRQAGLRVKLSRERLVDESPWASLEEGDLERVARAFEQLLTVDQELLRLHLWEELSYQEIGQVLRLTPNAVGVRLHRARKRLRDLAYSTHPERSAEAAKENGHA